MATLLFPDGTTFAKLSSRYLEVSGANTDEQRIYVPVSGADGSGRRLLAIDTGAKLSFLSSRRTAQAWGVYDITEYADEPLDYLVRRFTVRCDQGTVDLRFEADGGKALTCPVRFAFPTNDEKLEEEGFGVVGYVGALDRLRFAVSPSDLVWYFDRAA